MKTKIIIIGSICLLLLCCSTKDENNSELPNSSATTTEDLPSYTVLSRVNRIDGSGVDGDVLVSSFSKEIPLDILEKTLQSIAQKEGLDLVSLYCTEDAYKANFSASFLAEHPNALENGYLGRLKKDGTFSLPIK